MLKRLLWIVQSGLNHLWRVRTLDMLAPKTLSRIHERLARKESPSTPDEVASELTALITESHQTWLSPEEGRFLADWINGQIGTLLWSARRAKARAVESAIATDIAMEAAVQEE